MSAGSYMRAGLLRYRVSLFNIATTDDGAGGRSLASEENAVAPVVWAYVAPASWRQQQAHAGNLEQRITHCVTIRYQRELAAGGFGPDARLTFIDRSGTTRSLSIKTVVDPDERGRWLELGCLEGGPL